MTLTFDQSINIASLIGTWLGSLFTLLGLLAVFTQLRALLPVDRDEIVKNAAGWWASCLGPLRRSDTGVVEGRALSVAPWIRHYYSNRRDIDITPYERKLAGGQASWSRLFARLQIRPDDLSRMGGLRSTHGATDPMTMWSKPGLADLLVDGAKISYGMHGDEFAALLILSGFSPSDFHASETSSCTGHLGHLYLGPHGPFSQIAQLDGSLQPLSALQSETLGRHVHRVNVQQCIDLALGIFRFECLGQPRAVVLPTDDISEMEYSHGVPVLEKWFAKPSARRLLAVRRNLTHLSGGEISQNSQNHLFDLTQISHFEFRDLFFKEEFWRTPFGCSDVFPLEESTSILDTAMTIAVILAGLQPWGLPIVVPRSLVDGLCPLLRLFPSPSTDPPLLIEKVSELRRTVGLQIPGWTTWASLDRALDGLQAAKLQHFSGLSSRCSLYYDTMVLLFNLNSINTRSANIGLAAWCSSRYLASRCPDQPQYLQEWQSRCGPAIRERLNGEPMDEAPEWALEILATFLHAWLMDSHPIREDFRTIFRRRVFLG